MSSQHTSRLWHVNARHGAANDRNDATPQQPLRTIQAAAEQAQPGDTIRVGAGVYREWVRPARGGIENRPIIYEAAQPGQVVVRGSELFEPDWRGLSGSPGCVQGNLDLSWWSDRNPYHTGISITGADHNPQGRPDDGPVFPLTIGQLFAGGFPLTQVETVEELQRLPGSWMVSPDGRAIQAHFAPGAGPGEVAIELSVRHRIFAPIRRGLEHIHVRGFVFEHCAHQGGFPQAGAVSVRSGSWWRLEKNTVRLCGMIGLDLGSEFWKPQEIPDTLPEDQVGMRPHDNIIMGNTVNDNGLCGIAGIGTVRTQIVGNVIKRNNRLGFMPTRDSLEWYEEGGIKMHGMTDGLIEANLVRDNDAYGIWIDNGFTRARISRNVVLNNLRGGVFLEYGHGPVLVDNNVIALTRLGDGLYSHDASNVTVEHNLFWGNANYAVWHGWATDRQVGQASSEGPAGMPVNHSRWRVRGNVSMGNRAGAFSFPIETPGRCEDNRSNENVFIGGGLLMDDSADELPPIFEVNCSHKKSDYEQVAAAFEEAMDRHGVRREQRPNLGPWIYHHKLDLNLWRIFTGNDADAQVMKVNKPCMGTRTGFLEINLPEALRPLDGAPAEGVDRDLLGQPIPRNRALPGPFQQIERGFNRIVFWPAPL
jgi:hypothetical protein